MIENVGFGFLGFGSLVFALDNSGMVVGVSKDEGVVLFGGRVLLAISL